MPLNKLDNFLKNVEGRILYVSPSDLDASDAMSNQGNSQTTPFKTIQRALIESARFSYVPGSNNDITEKTTILLMPGEHIIDNRPGYKIKNNGGTAQVLKPNDTIVADGVNELSLNLESNFDLNLSDNILRKFNSVKGGVIVPRGTSIVGLDLRKTKIRPKYVPNPTDPSIDYSAIFRITGACYFWQFSIFDGKLTDKVYVDPFNYEDANLVKPSFSHHKLTCFEYADGVNKDETTNLTDLNMYYYKLSLAYGAATNDRNISEKFPTNTDGFVSRRPEFEIVGAFANDPIKISSITSGSSGVASADITVITQIDHGLDVGTPIRIKGVGESGYNISTNVTEVSESNPRLFKYTLPNFEDQRDINPSPSVVGAVIIVETDTVNGASPYIFNISLRSVFGMNGMHADGSKATGFRSMVVAQFTGVSLQKDDRAFVKYNKTNRNYTGLNESFVNGGALANGSSATNSSEIFHLDSDAIYRSNWETRHVRISNNAILQIVSVFAIGYHIHFQAESGSDASITNSNSNFGQLALVSDGFRKDAFAKDDRSFITHIIPPRAVTTTEEDIDWVALDKIKTLAGNDKKLYLFGFESEDIKPPSLTQGFRIGAKRGEKLFVDILGTIREAEIVMDDGTTDPTISSVKNISCTQSEGLFDSTVNHNLNTGEKIIIISDDGDLPEDIEEKTVYFAIKVSNTTFKVASSKTNADNGEFIKAYSTNPTQIFKVLSRVTDKDSGDVGHPVQWDGSQWYINVKTGNDIFSNINSLDDVRTEPSFVKRVSDTRSLDEKIYKLRMSIPKEIDNSKNPENGFIIQESNNTGITSVTEFNRTDQLTKSDFLFNRNPRFISSCTFDASPNPNVITFTAERPHNLTVGDLVTIKNVKDSSNTDGAFDTGYNGDFTVLDIPNSIEFRCETTRDGLGVATNDFNDKLTDNALNYPRFERTDLKSNIYIFRNNIISEYIKNTQDGVYQLFALNSSNFINVQGPSEIINGVSVSSDEFNDLKYSQNVVDVYPQLDRDNVDDNPRASKSFAVRQPLGQVITNDPLKSITRETNDKLLTKIGIGLSVEDFEDNTTTGIVSFTTEHNFGGIVAATLKSGTTGFTPASGITTYQNVKVYNNSATQNSTTWNGTFAKVIVTNGAITSFNITNEGSGWQIGQNGYFDKAVIGSGSNGVLGSSAAGAGLTVGNIGITTDLVIQASGVGVRTDSYFRIISAVDKKRVSVAKTVGDVNPIVGQFGFVVNPSSKISSKGFVSATGITTVTTSTPHGLVAGNRFQLNDSNNVNLGSFIVKSKVGVSTFTFKSTSDIVTPNGHILKHGLSANDGVSEKGNENLSIRGVELFDIENAELATAMVEDSANSKFTKVAVDQTKIHNINSRFSYGSYILIDEEIMRVATNSLTGTPANELTVIRGVFGTQISTHAKGSLIKKIKAFPVQFNRPSILRASGHTFEYLGYGPGNYSTALPQVQLKTISEKEEFLSQSQERAGGAVVYTGMNNKGDFYIGNQKKSALTGEETSFDTPIPSVAGEDPGRLSVVFDEVTIKERLVVEGGKSKTVLSEFDGPVTLNNETQFKDVVKIKTPTDSTSSTTGSLIITGGVGIGKTVSLPDNSKIKLGNSGDLELYHDGSNSYVTDSGTGSLRIGYGGTTELYHGTTKKVETLNVPVGAGATVYGDLFATNFRGSGEFLTGINNSQLLDDLNNVRVQAERAGAVVTGVTTTNQLNVTGISTYDGTATFHKDVVSKTKIILDGTGGDSTQGDIETAGGDDKAAIIRNISNSNLDGSSPSAVAISGRNANGSDQIICTFSVKGIVPIMECAGDIVAFQTSDSTLKDNISAIPNALDKINAISGNTFTWKDHPHYRHTGDDVGVIAQEIQSLGLPGTTSTRTDGTIAVNYEKLIPILIQAIKELSAKVDALS